MSDRRRWRGDPAPGARKFLSPIAFKAESVKADGTFEGYGNVFNVVDSYGDIVLPGAFADSLAAHKAAGALPKMLLQHEPKDVIGFWIDMEEDGYGLRCRGQLILDVEKARETHALMKAGALDALSIGGEPIDTDPAYVDELPALGVHLEPGAADGAGQVRLVKSWHLWETSVVTFPACAPALIDRETVKRRGPSPRESAELQRLARQVAANGRALSRLQVTQAVRARLSPACRWPRG